MPLFEEYRKGQKVRVIGYHGTNTATALAILQSKQFDEPHANGETDWLGDGIYFFETYNDLVEGMREAIHWVRYVVCEPAYIIIKATIESNYCLDMVADIGDRLIYQEIRQSLLDRWVETGRSSADFDDRKVFAAIRTRQSVDLIRCLVDAMPARGYDSKSHVVHRPQVQLCVTDRSCIKQVDYA